MTGEKIVSWDEVDEISQNLKLKRWAVKNTLKLFDEDCTIPFIARYRKEATNFMEADTLRECKQQYEDFKAVKLKVEIAINNIAKLGQLSPDIKTALKASKTLTEVENLYAPFKTRKTTLAERARELGLEPLAYACLRNPWDANIKGAIDSTKKGLCTLAEVESAVRHIISDLISKDPDVIEKMKKLGSCRSVQLVTKVKKSADDLQKKFELYYDFKIYISNIKPHQVLAINRGEHQKVLQVSVVVGDRDKEEFNKFCERKFTHQRADNYMAVMIRTAIVDGYKRLLEPMMSRHIRAELTKIAEKASVDVFASNLKKLLLAPPVRGKCVLGMDPGFRNGCKYALTSATGKVLAYGVVYLHTNTGPNRRDVEKIASMLKEFRCELVAIGNGTACRQTETFFSDHISGGTFKPLNVKYCIVNEDGASIYSASDEAKKELPHLDISIRGAVSIARRLQDPLAELVKIEPKHLGVGMYQHDVANHHMQAALDSVVEECVSFVGLDLNVCGEIMLRKVSGMSQSKAKKIIEWREKNGAFVCRQQILSVKGIGAKTYEQCVGFVRVMPETSQSVKVESSERESNTTVQGTRKRKGDQTIASKSKKKKVEETFEANPLDMTCIHPESYNITEKFLTSLNLKKDDVGREKFIRTIEGYKKTRDVKTIAVKLGTDEGTVSVILEGLTQALDKDYREGFEKPLFRSGIQDISTLKIGMALTGKVVNRVHFGAFVDIGVGRSGLLHSSKISPYLLGKKKDLELGDKVEVSVEKLDGDRISLVLKKLL